MEWSFGFESIGVYGSGFGDLAKLIRASRAHAQPSFRPR